MSQARNFGQMHSRSPKGNGNYGGLEVPDLHDALSTLGSGKIARQSMNTNILTGCLWIVIQPQENTIMIGQRIQ